MNFIWFEIETTKGIRNLCKVLHISFKHSVSTSNLLLKTKAFNCFFSEALSNNWQIDNFTRALNSRRIPRYPWWSNCRLRWGERYWDLGLLESALDPPQTILNLGFCILTCPRWLLLIFHIVENHPFLLQEKQTKISYMKSNFLIENKSKIWSTRLKVALISNKGKTTILGN